MGMNLPGEKQNEYLGKLITYWKAKDNRRVYTSGCRLAGNS